MQRMNAKEYAKSRGLPVETIRRLCRNNVLSNGGESIGLCNQA